MAKPDRDLIETFMSITGVPESVALQKLQEHHGDINEAVNAHFNQGDRNMCGPPISESGDDFMDIDDPVGMVPRDSSIQFPSTARTDNSFSILDPHYSTSLFGQGSDPPAQAPSVSRSREVIQIPEEAKDRCELSENSGSIPSAKDETETEHALDPETHETVVIDDDDVDIVAAPTAQDRLWNEQNRATLGDSTFDRRVRPSAPSLDTFRDDSSDIEEEMVRAAIAASKRGAEELRDPMPGQEQSHLENADLAHAVTLSLKTAEEEKLFREKTPKVGASETGTSKATDVELQQIEASNGRGKTSDEAPYPSRLEAESSSFQVEAGDVEEQPLVRNTTRRVASRSAEQPQNDEVIGIDQPVSPAAPDGDSSHQPTNSNAFASDEWGGISPAEHDEAVMLEAAMFGGIPESRYQSAYAPHQFVRPEESYLNRLPSPPSPSLEARRLIREQQDDEYVASLQADREKEMKARREAEARRLEEEAAKEAAREDEIRKEEEARRKMEEEQELERQLGTKEASLPQEPAADEESAITLLVRMPDGNRRGRRFMKSDKLQSLFDFIDLGRAVKPGTYRVVRPYPRRAFGGGESALTLNELGLTSKQEALFLELI